MQISEIPWKTKKLILFFGDESSKYIDEVRSVAEDHFVSAFPEHATCRPWHPWDHIEAIEHCTLLIHRHPEFHMTIFTNSTYIIDHLVNLMRGARLSAGPEFTHCKNSDAYIMKKDVGVYVCTKGEIADALSTNDDDDFINWDNLSEPAEWLSTIFFEMGEKYGTR